MEKVDILELRKYNTELIGAEITDTNSLVWVVKTPYSHQYIGSGVEISILKDEKTNIEYFFVQHGSLDGLDSFIIPVLTQGKIAFEVYYGEDNNPVISYIKNNYKIIVDLQNDFCEITKL